MIQLSSSSHDSTGNPTFTDANYIASVKVGLPVESCEELESWIIQVLDWTDI